MRDIVVELILAPETLSFSDGLRPRLLATLSVS